MLAARRAKTKEWLKAQQPKEIDFKDNDDYKKKLLDILGKNKGCLENLSAEGKEGNIPLITAVSNNNIDASRELIEAGANYLCWK